MEHALAELPLALFSTLAPTGAGAYAVLAVVMAVADLNETERQRIDRLGLAPLAFVLLGFIAAFFHLANPFHALGVFAGVGTSPLSNELVAGAAFFFVAAVYTGLAFFGKLGRARCAFAIVVGIIGLVFCAFVGLAYQMPTIPSWDTPIAPLETVCLGLTGGTALATLTLFAAKVVRKDTPRKIATPITAVGLIGAVASAALALAHLAVVSGMANAAISGASLASAAAPWTVAAAILLIVAAAADALAVKRGGAALPWIACAAAVIGVFLARLAFYALELSAGLAF